jgi:hypothetical protein
VRNTLPRTLHLVARNLGDFALSFFFKRLEKADYRGLVLFNRERWAGAEAELKGHSTRLAARGKFPPPSSYDGSRYLKPIEVT